MSALPVVEAGRVVRSLLALLVDQDADSFTDASD